MAVLVRVLSERLSPGCFLPLPSNLKNRNENTTLQKRKLRLIKVKITYHYGFVIILQSFRNMLFMQFVTAVGALSPLLSVYAIYA